MGQQFFYQYYLKIILLTKKLKDSIINNCLWVYNYAQIQAGSVILILRNPFTKNATTLEIMYGGEFLLCLLSIS